MYLDINTMHEFVNSQTLATLGLEYINVIVEISFRVREREPQTIKEWMDILIATNLNPEYLMGLKMRVVDKEGNVLSIADDKTVYKEKDVADIALIMSVNLSRIKIE